jgi:hypothetical protein
LLEEVKKYIGFFNNTGILNMAILEDINHPVKISFNSLGC